MHAINKKPASASPVANSTAVTNAVSRSIVRLTSSSPFRRGARTRPRGEKKTPQFVLFAFNNNYIIPSLPLFIGSEFHGFGRLLSCSEYRLSEHICLSHIYNIGISINFIYAMWTYFGVFRRNPCAEVCWGRIHSAHGGLSAGSVGVRWGWGRCRRASYGSDA